MKVRELIAQLQQCDPDMDVIMSEDEEGNGYSPLCEITEGMYSADSTWSGERYATPEEIAARDDMTEEDDGAPDGAVRAVFLWPTN